MKWYQIFCKHKWKAYMINDVLGIREYKCSKCGKIESNKYEQINFIIKF